MNSALARIVTCAVVALLIGAFAAGCSDDGESGGDSIVIAVQPTTTAAELSASADELVAFLEEETGSDIEMDFPTSYAGVIEALEFGHADAAFMGAWPASLAVEEAGGEIDLAEVREVNIDDAPAEEPFYYSYWVVPTDSEYQTLEDLRGKRVAFASQLSTSGYVAPLARMVELGLIEEPAEGEVADPEEFFDDALFAGGYAQAWEALEQGDVDVTIIAGDVAEDLYNEVLDNTRVIEEQGPVPSHSVVYSKDFTGEERDSLTQALLALGEEEHQELMRQFVSGIFVGFVETTADEHLGTLNEYLELTGLDFVEVPTTPTTPGAEPDPEPEADPEPGAPEPGVVGTPPPGAAQVNVMLREFSIEPNPTSVPAGEVYFLASNQGAEAHEVVVIRSDEDAGALPVVDGMVPEDQVDFLGEIEGFAPGSQASGVFDLTPGNYVLLCNIVEEEETGEQESHYEEGMHVAFSVE